MATCANISEFSKRLEKSFHDYQHKKTRSAKAHFRSMMQEFSAFDHQTKCEIFSETRFGRVYSDGVDPKQSNGELSFVLADLVTLWDCMVRNGLKVFESYHVGESRCMCGLHEPAHQTYPIDMIISYDWSISQDDPGFAGLIKTIYEFFPTEMFAVETVTKDEGNGEILRGKETFLMDLCKYPAPKVHCLKQFIQILQEKADANPEYVSRYVNLRDCYQQNCLRQLVGTVTHDKFYVEHFMALVGLGADPSGSCSEGWNTVSRSTNLVLKFLLQTGYKPANIFIPDKYAKSIAEKELRGQWNEIFWPCLNLTPQMFDVWRLATQANPRKWRHDTEERVLTDEDKERILNFGDAIIEDLQLYDQFAPECVDYSHKSATGHTMLDYAKLSGHQGLIEFIGAHNEHNEANEDVIDI